jgi:Domain of unknown function (DUF4129)
MVMIADVPSLAGAPGGGLRIGRRAAQQLAHRELSKAVYQPSVYQQFLAWLSRRLGQVNATVPGGWWALVALVVVVVLVIAVVIFWIRPARTRRGSAGALLTGKPLSARDHRRSAERSAAVGDFSAAIIERTRAIAVELEERGVLPPRPGRTADELAAEAGQAMPEFGRELAAVALLFDEVMYGGRDGTQPGYLQASELDVGLQRARPAGPVTPQAAGAAPESRP